MTTLKELLSEASAFPNAESIWKEFAKLSLPTIELRNYFDEATYTTLLLEDTETDTTFEICWYADEEGCHVAAEDEDIETVTLLYPDIEEVLKVDVYSVTEV